MELNRFIQRKKKNIRKVTLRLSEAVVWRCSVKKKQKKKFTKKTAQVTGAGVFL